MGRALTTVRDDTPRRAKLWSLTMWLANQAPRPFTQRGLTRASFGEHMEANNGQLH
jgi:hypothetical protein